MNDHTADSGLSNAQGETAIQQSTQTSTETEIITKNPASEPIEFVSKTAPQNPASPKVPALLDSDAWAQWCNPHGLGPNLRYANFIRQDTDLMKLEKVLQRPLTLSELQLLVLPDGDKQECMMCQKEFQPFKWARVGRILLDEVAAVGSLESVKDKIGYYGCFYVSSPDRGSQVGSFCGYPYQFHMIMRDGRKTTVSFVPDDQRKSRQGIPCLVHAAVGKKHDTIECNKSRQKPLPVYDYHWGMTYTEATEIVERRHARDEERRREEADRLKRVSGFFGNTVIPNGQHGEHGRDRRHDRHEGRPKNNPRRQQREHGNDE